MGRCDGVRATSDSSRAASGRRWSFWVSAVELVDEFLTVAEFWWFPGIVPVSFPFEEVSELTVDVAAVEDLFYIPVLVFVGVWVFRYDFFGLANDGGVFGCRLQ